MKEEPVDPRMEKLIASLYGELPAEEERELKELLKRDPALQAEWDDLVSMRGMLAEYQVEEAVPSFVMVDPEPVRRVRTGGFRETISRIFSGFVPVSGWAVAAAAILVLVLTLKGYRVEKIDGGYALRNTPGTSDVAVTPEPAGSEPVVPDAEGVTASPGQEEPRQAAPATREVTTPNAAPPVQLVSGEYMTRQEFEAKQVSMLRMFAEIMNADRARRDAETASMLRTIYGSMNDRQLSNYEELRGRIEAVGLGLMAEQSKTNERLDLMQQTVLDSLGLADDQENRNGGEKK